MKKNFLQSCIMGWCRDLCTLDDLAMRLEECGHQVANIKRVSGLMVLMEFNSGEESNKVINEFIEILMRWSKS